MLLQAKESSILLSSTMLINCVSYICNPRENNCRSMHGIFPDSIQLNWMSPAPYKVSKRQPLNEQHLESKTISAILSTVCNWFEGHQITMNSGFNSRWIPPNSQCILRVISSWLNRTRGNYWFSPFMEVKANVNMVIWHAILWSLTFDYTNSNHDSENNFLAEFKFLVFAVFAVSTSFSNKAFFFSRFLFFMFLIISDKD